MNLEKRKNIFDIIIILLLLVVLIGLLYLVRTIKEEGGQCVKDPLRYYNSLGKDKCTVTCIGGRLFNNKNILIEPVASQINTSEWNKFIG